MGCEALGHMYRGLNNRGTPPPQQANGGPVGDPGPGPMSCTQDGGSFPPHVPFRDKQSLKFPSEIFFNEDIQL